MSRRLSPARALRNSLPGPDDIHREVLPNGIVVLARANFSSQAIALRGYVRAGSVLDPDSKLGLADFTASALTRGTSQYSFDALYDKLESVGASLGFDSGMDSTTFHGHSLSEDLPLLLGMLASTLRTPTFPTAEVEKLRHHLLTGLAIRMQDTADMADLLFDEMLFRGHPYARAEDGNPRTIGAISRQDLVSFHKRAYGPNGMVVAVVGSIDPKRAVDAVHRALGSWRNPRQTPPPTLADPRRLRSVRRKHHHIPGKAQADLIIGTNGPRRNSAEYLPASLGNSILGQFGMMGRIGKSVREQSGLAYYAYSQLNTGLGPGSWTVSAGVNPANAARASELIVAELRRFVRSGVSAEELSDSQSNFIGRLPMSLESNAGVAGALLSIERYDLGLDYYRKYASLIRKISRADVLKVARAYIDPDRLVISTAGP
ncbi:MAG: M16 family metallopeptidase [Anaerolineales bacterium]